MKWSFGAEESELHTYVVNNMRQQYGSDFLVAAMATSSPENTIDIYFARLTIFNMSAEPARNSKEGLIYVDELSIPMDLLATNGK
ncbi:hypothetical protein QUB56_28245 [Microcoleus sp. AR_TQ3_B6]|uniref:hypothetical protein n=1 Tax=Microcoleus sp. AR_TQ3_B6 TaxID=3055284 RepID=UPI002FD6D7FF